MVNVGVSTFSSNAAGVLTGNRTDAFQFGARRMNLVRTIDLVFITSWSETFTYHYEGNGAVLEALAECLQWADVDNHETGVPPIEAHCSPPTTPPRSPSAWRRPSALPIVS